MHVAVLALVGLAALSTLIALSMHLATRAVFRRRRRRAVLAPVSILKPLRGIDDGLAENLESFAGLEYPEYEILLGAEDPLDPALPLARAFARRHPERRIEVLVCDRSTALNPKVRVLETLAARARYDLLLVSDSNVRVDPMFLEETAGEMGP